MISFFTNLANKYAYINFHAEQSFRELSVLNFTNDVSVEMISLGVFCSELKNSAIVDIYERAEKIISNCNNSGIDTLIIDLNRIKQIQINQNDEIHNLIMAITSKNIDIIIINCKFELVSRFNGLNKACELDNDDKMIIGFSNESQEKVKGKIKNIKNEGTSQVISKICAEAFNEAIDICCSTNTNEEIDSSQVYTTKYINIKECIEKVEYFPFIVYRLALSLLESGLISSNANKNNQTSIFCHTLNGSYIGSILAYLLGIDILFYDHIGPKNKLYNTYLGNRIDKNKSYLIVTDVICLGSELRSVRTLLEYEGAKFIGTASIVNILTTSSSRNKNDICSVVEINKDNNPFLYYIYTDLERKREVDHIGE
ncbi:hypothetical protein [Clostridium sp.]|uniref:hypothetical protein n=1 Tax=Clostridium sp. TaxID=1506 RepID=UPI0026080A03|nr:hypothetical protein [Clostridium sp.]